MKNQRGFTLVEGLLIVLILSVIGFAGYTVWNNNQDDEAEVVETTQQDSTNQSSDDINPSTAESDSSAEVATDWSCAELNQLNNTSDAYFIDLINDEGINYRSFEEIDNQTYLGASCTKDDVSVVSFSHANYGESGGGPKLIENLIGLAVIKNDVVTHITSETPCVPGPPDATAPFSLEGSSVDTLLASCAGINPSPASFEFIVSTNTIQ
ncbi:MAG: Tfp pilus assembly protein PilV [Candidatus Saccharimonadales bacterium]|jgi:Tfp pilus assembly protein PilV